MHLGSGGNQSVHSPNRTSTTCASSYDDAPRIGHDSIDREHTALEPVREVLAQPRVEALATPTRRQALDAVTKLCHRHHAQEDIVLVNLAQPGCDS